MKRILPLLLLGSSAALLWWVPRPVPDHESGDAQAEAPGHVPGTIVVDLVDDASAADVAAAGKSAGVLFALASEVSADEALYVADVDDEAAALGALSGNPLVEASEVAVEMEAFSYP